MVEHVTAIIASLKKPEVLTPRQVSEFSLILSAYWADVQQEMAAHEAKTALLKAQGVEAGESAAKATIKAHGSISGQALIHLRGDAKGLEEVIKACKKAQAFYSDEAHGLF